MKYGLFSDVHGHYSKLIKVINFLEKEGVDEMLCGGDLVSYGDYSNNVIDKFIELNIRCVMGNHDFYCANENIPLTVFNDHSEKWIKDLRNSLTNERKKYLRSLPLIINESDFQLVHSSLEHPQLFNYLMQHPKISDEDFYESVTEHAKLMKTNLSFIGHTHVPRLITVSDRTCITVDESYDCLEINHNFKYIVNLGSIAFNRNGNYKSNVVIYDDRAKFLRQYFI